MRRFRVRFTIRGMMLAVAVAALLLATGGVVWKRLGPRAGSYAGSYRYLGRDLRWHEVRGASITVLDGGSMITD